MRLKRCTFAYDGNGEHIFFLGVDGYLIEWPEGVDALTMSFSEGRAPDGVGSHAWETVIPARPITINGYILAKPAEKHARRLLKAFAAGSTGTFTACDIDGIKYSLECRVVSTPAIEGATALCRFQLQIRADYPLWQKNESSTVSLASLGSAASVNIAGDSPALFTARITIRSGTASGVSIRDEGSGEVLRFDGSVGAGQTLVIQTTGTGRVSCTVGGSSAINGITGGLRKLQPGARRVGVYVSGSAAGSAEIIYREAYSGV